MTWKIPPLTDKNADTVADLKFHFIAGLFVRRRMEAAVKRLALWHDIDVKIVEDKGLLESIFTARASGPYRSIYQFATAMNSLILQYDAD